MKAVEFYQIISGLSFKAVELGNKEYRKKEEKEKVVKYMTSVANLIRFINSKKNSDATFSNEEYRELIKQIGDVFANSAEISSFIPADVSKRINEQLNMIGRTAAYIDPNKNLSLTKAIDSIEIGNYKLDKKADTAGNLSSSRRKIAIKNANNEEVEGYFTKDVKLFDRDKYQKITAQIDAYVEQHQDDVKLIEFVNKVKSNKPYGIHSLIGCFEYEGSLDNVKENRATLYQCYERNKILEQNILPLGEGIEILESNANIKNLLIKIRKSFKDDEARDVAREFIQYGNFGGTGIAASAGSSLAGRTIAVSNVANILGVPHLIAKSVPMTIKEGGKEVTGVFMEKAVGNDICADDIHKTDFMLVHNNSFGARGLKQIADLDVIDYICQNVDRHLGNMLYNIDETGEIVGIQGIDNDLSFGTSRNTSISTIQNGTKLNDIKVMTSSMAERIRELQPEMLEAALSGIGLSEAEIKAAAGRLNDLKMRIDPKVIEANKNRAVKKPEIEIVNDAEWENKTVHNLSFYYDQLDCSNLFKRAKEAITSAIEEREKKYEDIDAYKALREAKLKKNKKKEKFVKAKVLDELSKENLKSNQDRILNYYKSLMKFEKSQGENAEQFKVLKDKLEILLKYKPEDMQLSDDDEGGIKLTPKQKADAKANRERQLWLYMDDMVKTKKALEIHIKEHASFAEMHKNYKKQHELEKEMAEFLLIYEDVVRQAFLEEVEEELENISIEVNKEQYQYDTILEKLSEKVYEKFPQFNRDQIKDFIQRGPVLRYMLTDENDYQTYFDVANDMDYLYNVFASCVMMLGEGGYRDPLHKAIFDRVTANNGIVAPAEVLCKDDDKFKNLLMSQEHKYAFATVNLSSKQTEGKAKPEDLALIFAERVVTKKLYEMSKEKASDETLSKVEELVRDYDYVPDIEKIVEDPAFIKIYGELPKEEFSPSMMNTLFEKYIKEKASNVEVKAADNNNPNGGQGVKPEEQKEAKSEDKKEEKAEEAKAKAAKAVKAPKSGK